MDNRTEKATSGIISILTDFGTADGYPAAMKGVILSVNPSAVLVDVTHTIPPQDVRGAAFVLHTVHRHFPPRSVHLAVVDPGVGTERAAVILDTGQGLFVAPDNGLLSFLFMEKRSAGEPTIAMVDSDGTISVQVPEGWRAVRIAESRFWMPSPSRTFHGRDIFAPVAAHLCRGEPPESFGPPMGSLRSFEIPLARKLPAGAVEGAVLHVDRFGNLITSVRGEDLPRGTVVVEVGIHAIQGLSRTYAEGRGLTALLGSAGYLEIALPGGSARDATGLGVGAVVRVVPAKGTRH